MLLLFIILLPVNLSLKPVQKRDNRVSWKKPWTWMSLELVQPIIWFSCDSKSLFIMGFGSRLFLRFLLTLELHICRVLKHPVLRCFKSFSYLASIKYLFTLPTLGKLRDKNICSLLSTSNSNWKIISHLPLNCSQQ